MLILKLFSKGGDKKEEGATPLSMTEPTQGSNNKQTPYLHKQERATQLIVDGEPFLILGGELHNSSSSNLEYMRPIWGRMVALNLNTVLAPVSWELIEPEEGIFDFTLVDGLIQDARRHDLRLIFLWFGSWKNGMSSYIPALPHERSYPWVRFQPSFPPSMSGPAARRCSLRADSENDQLTRSSCKLG